MKNRLLAVILITSSIFMVSACASFPDRVDNEGQSPSTSVVESRLSQIFSETALEQDEKSGFILLREGLGALRERILLAEIAEQSIDAQYFIWNSDNSGKLLLSELVKSADRGVSVRILLDDFNVGDRSEQLLAVNSHPNIQIRVYNPFVTRSGFGKWLNLASDFDRLNRRMHNKTYIVDGTVAIVGGRNIGDEYFDQNEHINFSDLDLLTIGPVVQQVAESFNTYWKCPWAIPIDQLIQDTAAQFDQDYLRKKLEKFEGEQTGRYSITEKELAENHYQESINEFIWAPAFFIQDEPVSHEEDQDRQRPKAVAQKLRELAEKSEQEILIESAYFVLNKNGAKLAKSLTEKGVQIRALTNSMASNDVLPNHASYAMVRKQMLKSGIQLYELRPDAESCLAIIGRKEACDKDSFLSLHSKSAVFDHRIVYVGSLNLNLRSAYLNTEVAMIIESPVIAAQLIEQIELNMKPENSWQAVIEDGQLQWETIIDGKLVKSDIEPQTSWLQRVKAGILALLPGAKYY